MAQARVRPVESDDVPSLAALQQRTWRTAFSRLLSEHQLQELTSAEAESSWQAAIAAADVRVLLAEEGAAMVGGCVVGPDPELAATALIASLFVEQRWSRRGHGGRLLHAACLHGRELGATTGALWAVRTDRAMQALLESVGWAHDGTIRSLEPEDLSGAAAEGAPSVHELRYLGPLALNLSQ